MPSLLLVCGPLISHLMHLSMAFVVIGLTSRTASGRLNSRPTNVTLANSAGAPETHAFSVMGRSIAQKSGAYEKGAQRETATLVYHKNVRGCYRSVLRIFLRLPM